MIGATMPRTRNQRLAALHTLFDYIASREPQMLGVCQQVAAIPARRAAPAETRFLERDEVEALFRSLPRKGRLALRDRALLLFLYNTGARVQEAADLRAGDLDLGEYPVPPARQGRQVADLPAMAPDSPTARRATRPAWHDTGTRYSRVPLRDRPGTDPVRHLQDRAASRRVPRRHPR